MFLKQGGGKNFKPTISVNMSTCFTLRLLFSFVFIDFFFFEREKAINLLFHSFTDSSVASCLRPE